MGVFRRVCIRGLGFFRQQRLQLKLQQKTVVGGHRGYQRNPVPIT